MLPLKCLFVGHNGPNTTGPWQSSRMVLWYGIVSEMRQQRRDFSMEG